MTPRSVLLFLLALSYPPVSAAQGVAPAPPHPAPSAFLWQHARADVERRESHEPLGGFLGPGDEDYRYPGFFIGTGIGAVGLLYVLASCRHDGSDCDSSEGRAVFAGLVVGTVVLGLTGAVIGGLIPKPAE